MHGTIAKNTTNNARGGTTKLYVSVLVDVQDDCRCVVGRPGVQRTLNRFMRCVFRRVSSHRTAQRIVIERAMHAVGADQPLLARFQAIFRQRRRELGTEADAVRQHMAIRVIHRRAIRRTHHRVHPGVVFRLLQQRAVAQHIGAAVADVTDHDSIAFHQRGNDGRPHAGVRGIALAGVVHPAIGETKCRLETVQRHRMAGIERERPCDIAAVVGRANEIDNRVDRQSRGDLSGIVPAHAVCNDEESQAEVDEVRILVHHPRAGVGRSGGTQTHC